MNIGILIEMEKGRVKDANFGVITLARKASDAVITALVLDPGAAVAELETYGVHTVADIALAGEQEVRMNPDVRARALVAAAKELKLDLLLGLSTAGGRDVIPRVAALAGAPLVMDCMDLDPGSRTARTSQYSGKVLADIQLTGELAVFGIRPNAVAPVPAPVRAEIIAIDTTDLAPEGLTLVGWDEGEENMELPSLAEADIIVAGGRGVQGEENFQLLFDCAKQLNAAVGASRAAVDERWISYAHQVGQTGEKVSPSVYLALGISGSVQHFAGMKDSGTIIAVNTDDTAAMMVNADYRVRADLFEVLPELILQLGETGRPG